MRTRSRSSAGPRREASAGLTAGALVLLAGYLLPWFQLREREWWVSGLRLLQDWDGAAWTVLPLLCFGGAVVAGLWAVSHEVAAVLGLVAVVAGAFLTFLLMAASFAYVDVSAPSTQITDSGPGLGLLLVAAGLGTALVGGVRAVVRWT